MFNYLFYRFLQVRIHKPTYWAKIFVPIIEVLVLLPAALTLSKFFFGCYNQQVNDGTIKIFLSVFALLVWGANSLYYSPDRIRKINEKYSSESRLQGNLKLILICLLLFFIFWFGSAAIRMVVRIPAC